MISNFNQIVKTVSIKYPEDFVSESGNFIDAGSGSIADTDYDHIYTYIGFDDGHLNQLEFYHLASDTNNQRCTTRWLVDGVAKTNNASPNIYVPSYSSAPAKSFKVGQIKDGETVIIEYFWHEEAYAFEKHSMCLMAEVFDQQHTKIGAFHSYYGSGGSADTPSTSPVQGVACAGSFPLCTESSLVVVRPLVFVSSTSGNKYTRYIYDDTTSYSVQSMVETGAALSSGDNRWNTLNGTKYSVVVQDFTIVEVNNMQFVNWRNCNYGSDNSSYQVFLRIS